MKASVVRVALFENAVLATLEADVNKFFNGEAVGAFGADFVAEKEFIDIKYEWDGTMYTAMIIYAG
jgi:hypothetical protein